ncbi:hypothetical protein B0A50_03991 [Salinomyces thailandicus]|uniref:Integral membrane protein n=1 Tax=Salinomyces thailandicus TaxID=706561 RepID=A0A4U0U0Q9_9PEZI|nr:hypothetical protein B0A50_03991 [Salinomyces thailandica]
MRTTGFFTIPAAALLLGALPLVAGHGEDPNEMASEAGRVASYEQAPMSYFRHGHYGGWMLAHAVMMILAWFIWMPFAVMLSTARSRYHLPAQVVFHIINGLGIFSGFVYSHSTPDLYKGNAHHPLGWALTALAMAWTATSLLVAYGDYKTKRSVLAQSGLTSSADLSHQYSDQSPPTRWSRDSGIGSSRQNSADSIHQKLEQPQSPASDNDEEHGEDNDSDGAERRRFLDNGKVDKLSTRYIQRLSSARALNAARVSQILLEKFLLLLGFATIASGFLVYGGLSRDRAIFSILAHFIKGGIFFWYGLLTLGRWMGAFSEFGWAWNTRPSYPSVSRWKTRIPSAEFVESFVIWLYGTSNVFLEHLTRWGKEWSAQDLEHISITVLFFGGGLLGMLIESRRLREMFNTSVVIQQLDKDEELAGASRFPSASRAADESADHLDQDRTTYQVPLNPMPGLVIMTLGAMMSGHHQDSMVSTMMHAQWGTLFFAFACARAATYAILYIKPPTSPFPARPPSELVSAFCLTSGGLMFMISARDTVEAVESNGLDAMSVFTVTVGLTGIIMAWEFVCFAIKGWAIRKEQVAVGKLLVG